MNKAETEKFRKLLIDMGRELDGQVDGLKGEALRATADEVRGNLSKAPIHLGDLGSEHYNQQVAADLLQHERDLLAEVVAAVERIDQGTFGTCEACRRPIGRERLQALPYTRHCIDCARELDGE